MANSPRQPTIADVAQRANVSKGAVSFALNGRPGVSEQTRARILETAASLGWTPSSSARALSTARASAVGLVIARPPDLLGADPFFAPFIAGVESVLAPRGQSLVLQMVDAGDSELVSYRRLAVSARVDGVFLIDLRVEDPRPELLRELGLPAVLVGRLSERDTFPAVTLDDRPGVTAAVEHLITLGHRLIAHVAGPDHFVHGRDRQRAWAQALADAALPTSLCIAADFTASGGAAATAELLRLPEPPTAIVYANDLMAIAGLHVLTQHGISVPGDISITGFDDTELGGYLAPPLTSIRTDVLGWGRQSALTLLSLTAGEDTPSVQLAPASLVVRDSTGPAPMVISSNGNRKEAP